MNTVILIVVLGMYGGKSSAVTMQEFNSITQCQYAMKIIRESADRIINMQCVNK
jgi:hypothetical protein